MQSKERKGSNFAAQRIGAIVQKPEEPNTYDRNLAIASHLATMAPVGGEEQHGDVCRVPGLHGASPQFLKRLHHTPSILGLRESVGLLNAKLRHAHVEITVNVDGIGACDESGDVAGNVRGDVCELLRVVEHNVNRVTLTAAARVVFN